MGIESSEKKETPRGEFTKIAQKISDWSVYDEHEKRFRNEYQDKDSFVSLYRLPDSGDGRESIQIARRDINNHDKFLSILNLDIDKKMNRFYLQETNYDDEGNRVGDNAKKPISDKIVYDRVFPEFNKRLKAIEKFNNKAEINFVKESLKAARKEKSKHNVITQVEQQKADENLELALSKLTEFTEPEQEWSPIDETDNWTSNWTEMRANGEGHNRKWAAQSEDGEL